MSNSLAIANVTQALVNLLDSVKTDFPNTDVTAKPPDNADPSQSTRHGLNLFLYRTEMNTGWRNQPMPQHAKPGETGQPPLPLNLHYLLSVYSAEDDEVEGHKVLGYAMGLLHDHPVLSRAELESALSTSDLHEQIERVRITYEPLSLDDMFRIWGSLNTAYRMSVAYEVTAVLIESQRPTVTPLPVLTPAIVAQRSLEFLPSFPIIQSIEIPDGKNAAELGDTLTINGNLLTGDTVSVQFDNEHLSAPIALTPTAGTSRQLTVQLPNTPAAFTTWTPGLFRVWVDVTTAGQTQSTNELPLSLAPRITGIAPNPAVYGGGDITLTVDSQPNIREVQRLRLLLGAHEVLAEEFVGSAVSVDFTLRQTQLPAGTYFARLRVDGVDSEVIDRTADPLAFNTTVQVEVQS